MGGCHRRNVEHRPVDADDALGPAQRFCPLRCPRQMGRPLKASGERPIRPSSIKSSGVTVAASDLDLLQGTLDLLILKTLSWGPRHGYAVASWIRQTTRD